MDSESVISDNVTSERKCMMVTKESIFFVPDESTCPPTTMDTSLSKPHSHTIVRKTLLHVEPKKHRVPISVLKMAAVVILLTLVAVLMARNNHTFQLNLVFCCLGVAIGFLCGSLVYSSEDQDNCKQA